MKTYGWLCPNCLRDKLRKHPESHYWYCRSCGYFNDYRQVLMVGIILRSEQDNDLIRMWQSVWPWQLPAY